MDDFSKRPQVQQWMRGFLLVSLVRYSYATFVLEKETIFLTRNKDPDQRDTKKLILFWTKWFGSDNAHLYDDLLHCPEPRCAATSDRSLLSRSSALIFHGRDMSARDIPQQRQSHQQYVFHSTESPYLSHVDLRKEIWTDFFNLTWTYRTDSDIVSGFYFHPHRYSLKIWTNRTAQREILAKRMNRAVILMSNCGASSNRDEYIKQLQQYFPVDVFGRCRDSLHRACSDCEERPANYKFYLAFENGLCKDYVTEKATRTYQTEVLPVMLGGANYSGIFPPHSFIDTADFESPRQLATYLWKLSRNLHLYEEYFDWKYEEQYLAIPEVYQPAKSDICRLCEILHDEERLDGSSSYENLDEWWTTASHCFSPLFSYPARSAPSIALTVTSVLLGLVLLFNLVYFGHRYRSRLCKRATDF